jgi:hypothetical protein
MSEIHKDQHQNGGNREDQKEPKTDNATQVEQTDEEYLEDLPEPEIFGDTAQFKSPEFKAPQREDETENEE